LASPGGASEDPENGVLSPSHNGSKDADEEHNGDASDGGISDRDSVSADKEVTMPTLESLEPNDTPMATANG